MYVVWWYWSLDYRWNGCVYDHDTALFEDFFPRGQHQYVNSFDDLPSDTGAIVVLNGENTDAQKTVVAEKIKTLPWVVLFSIQDGNARLHLEEFQHPNMRIWVHAAKKGRHDDYRHVPVGYAHSFRYSAVDATKTLDWLFIGRNHPELPEWTRALNSLVGGVPTERCVWSNQGILIPDRPHNMVSDDEYVRLMCSAKIVICRPPGLRLFETGRVYEALEAGAIPIACPGDWEYVLGEQPPFPITDAANLETCLQSTLRTWPERVLEIQDWWKSYKARLKVELVNDIEKINGAEKLSAPSLWCCKP